MMSLFIALYVVCFVFAYCNGAELDRVSPIVWVARIIAILPIIAFVQVIIFYGVGGWWSLLFWVMILGIVASHVIDSKKDKLDAEYCIYNQTIDDEAVDIGFDTENFGLEYKEFRNQVMHDIILLVPKEGELLVCHLLKEGGYDIVNRTIISTCEYHNGYSCNSCDLDHYGQCIY